ncbi:RNA polymerase sigma factor [Microbulbifer thermotolerans]|uniref:RNA polymerase sigma factor n=1 Tax=Microbulbifer thermotolerans TaxID=252514 RepID=A0AB35HYZ7_MICTH|nr:sigma-70 family RNA polymerase sigma factor [Microbulbifer thermotolerans]MCX2802469.1 RNA polymerase sigma factor [Microbulbifer thermotolerans]MCX2830337.1 RNA polymerase sigma factor [Microbulbifer thermotolerans]MCX2840322.1 RNA polymerase sigma factor [Microbulbifer thermotolerans]
MLQAWNRPLATDNKALGDYYREHHRELCRYATHKFGLSEMEAEDVVQSAFARFAPLHDTAEMENARAFLYRAVNNASIDLLRRNQVRSNFAQSALEDPEREIDAVSPERIATGRQLLKLISRALWGMPQKRRRLLLMNRVDGLSYAEIARREGLSATVVKKHVAKALAACQAELRANGGDW